VHLGLASITSERRRLTDVLSQKLTRLELSAPVRSMELVSGSLRPLIAGSLDAFAGLAVRARATVAATRRRNWWSVLRARLGEEAGLWGSLRSRNIGPKRPRGASKNCVWPRPIGEKNDGTPR